MPMNNSRAKWIRLNGWAEAKINMLVSELRCFGTHTALCAFGIYEISISFSLSLSISPTLWFRMDMQLFGFLKCKWFYTLQFAFMHLVSRVSASPLCHWWRIDHCTMQHVQSHIHQSVRQCHMKTEEISKLKTSAQLLMLHLLLFMHLFYAILTHICREFLPFALH